MLVGHFGPMCSNACANYTFLMKRQTINYCRDNTENITGLRGRGIMLRVGVRSKKCRRINKSGMGPRHCLLAGDINKREDRFPIKVNK